MDAKGETDKERSRRRKPVGYPPSFFPFRGENEKDFDSGGEFFSPGDDIKYFLEKIANGSSISRGAMF